MDTSQYPAQLAAEIAGHDWSDAPYRLDRAGHQRAWDRRGGKLSDDVLDAGQTDAVRANVALVTGQVLAFNDPTFDIHGYVEDCGVPASLRLNSDGKPSGRISEGLRYDHPVTRPAGPMPRNEARFIARPGTSGTSLVKINLDGRGGADAATAGQVRIALTDTDAVQAAATLLTPGTMAILTADGHLQGNGAVEALKARGPWLVIEWHWFLAGDGSPAGHRYTLSPGSFIETVD